MTSVGVVLMFSRASITDRCQRQFLRRLIANWTSKLPYRSSSVLIRGACRTRFSDNLIRHNERASKPESILEILALCLFERSKRFMQKSNYVSQVPSMLTNLAHAVYPQRDQKLGKTSRINHTGLAWTRRWHAMNV